MLYSFVLLVDFNKYYDRNILSWIWACYKVMLTLVSEELQWFCLGYFLGIIGFPNHPCNKIRCDTKVWDYYWKQISHHICGMFNQRSLVRYIYISTCMIDHLKIECGYFLNCPMLQFYTVFSTLFMTLFILDEIISWDFILGFSINLFST